MVGMSGKASEPRRGHSTQQKKAAVGPVGPGGSNKTQPPPEALHVANILGDGIYPADLAERMKQVLNTLPTSTEEEVCIALHDHDFDPTRAITALLDSDAQTSSQGEWTTQKKGRRGKGSDGSTDFIIAPGDSRLPGRQGGGRGTSRAASQSVRESYGGSVSVERGRGRPSGRGRSSSGRREREEGKREERGVREKAGPRERGARVKNRGARAGRTRPRPPAAETERPVEDGGRVEEKTVFVPIATETWDDPDPQPSTEWDDRHQTGSPVVSLHTATADLLDPAVEQTWDSEAESKSSQPLFPEAFTDPATTISTPHPLGSGSLTGVLIASCAQPTTVTPPLLYQPTPGSVPQQATPGSLSRQHVPVEFQTGSVPSSAVSSRHRPRHKRLARSRIPSQPVEMPKGTYPEMSELGIAFGGLELPPTSTDSTSREPPQQEALLATPTTNDVRYTNIPVTSAPMTYSTQFTEDSGVVSIATSSTYSGKKLEAPPGLPHPMSAMSAASGVPHSSLPTSGGSVVPSGALPHTVVPSGSLPHSAVPSGSLPHTVVPSGLLPHSVVPGGPLPHPIVSSGPLQSSSSGNLPHSATLADSGPQPTPPTTAHDTVVSTTTELSSQLPTTADGSATHSQGSVGSLLAPDHIPLPPRSSLLPAVDLPPPPSSEHTTFTTTASSQLLTQPFTTVSTSSVVTVGGASELLQATPTSSMGTPTSKALTAQSSSHHHGNQQQLQAQLQGSAKSTSVQQQQQQQQAMIYPYMLQPPLVYYDPSEMSRYQASASMAYYQHPTSTDPAMVTGMARDHGGSGFVSEGVTGAAGGGKFGSRGAADISTSTTPSNPSHSQQQGPGVQQGQMSHAAVFSPYYGGNVIYPMYPGYGMPGFSAHSLPKPSGGSSYPGGGVNSYQAPSGAGFGYEDVGTGQEYKMYGGMAGGGGLGKTHTMTSSPVDLQTATGGYKQHHAFDTGKAAGSNYSTYSVPQGGYGFIPTGPVPLQMPPNYMPSHEAGSGRSQKHSKPYSGSHGNSSQLWSQQPSH